MKKCFLIFVFLFALLINAQSRNDYLYNDTPLLKVLNDAEASFKVSFSYASDIIEEKTININAKGIALDDVLNSIEAQTGLVFKNVSENEIIIFVRKPAEVSKVCGYLLESDTHLPITEATIFISDTKITSTNSKGFFSFKKTAANVYKTDVVGFENIEFKGTNKCTPVYLTPNMESLNEVIVSAYITNGIDRNKDGSVEVNTKRLGILPGLLNNDISQSIQLIPGVSTLDESATSIQIRGGSPDQNLVLYDNIKLYNTGHLYGMFSLFNPFATQKATVFRSGTSASYGDRISGIIDISSGKNIPKTTHGGIEIDGLVINGFVKTPLSKTAAFYVFARRSYSDLWETPTYSSYAEKIFTNFGTVKDINGNVLELETDDNFSPKSSNNNFAFSDLNTKLIIKPNKENTISLSGLYTRNRLDFDFIGGGELIIDSLITKNKGLSIDWEHKTNSKQKERLTAYYSEYNSFYENREIKDETGDNIPDLTEINTRQNDIIDLGLNLSSITQIKPHQKLTLGYQFSYVDLDVTISKEKPLENGFEDSGQDNTNLKNVLFGEYTFNFKNKAFINAGLRLVHYNAVNSFLVEPRINFEYPLTYNLRIKTAVERRNQPISQLIEFNHTELRLENNLWRLSDNLQYPLLSSNQISGGLLYNYKKVNVDFDIYYKELKGLTTFTNGFSNPLENLEEGKSTITGLDLLLKYQWQNYKIWASYTFNDITFQFPNLENTDNKFPGNNDITHHFRISNTLKTKRWQFSLGWQYRTGRPVTPINSYEIKIDADGENAGVVNFGTINGTRLPNFHRLDASILYDFELKKLNAQLGLSLLNIYNRVKPLNLIYKAERKPLDDGGIAIEGTTSSNPEDLEIILEQVIQRFSLGFTPNVSFKLFF